MKSDPKAIYIKRKHFKDVNPKLMNPENVLTTDITKQELKGSLTKEERYVALVDRPAKKSALSFLLPNLTPQKAQLLQSRVKPPQPNQELYFKLLKEDRLDMMEIYLTLKRELGILQNHPKADSLIASNLALMMTFEKWLGVNDFETLVQDELSLVKKVTHQLFRLQRRTQNRVRNYLNTC